MMRTKNNEKPFVSAVIVAGGTASRMGGIDKCFYPLLGVETIYYSIKAFEENDYIDEIVLVTRADMTDKLHNICKTNNVTKLKDIVVGGGTRHKSVESGVKATSNEARYIVIHDGGRPLVSNDMITRSISTAFIDEAVITAVPVKDTIKRSLNGNTVTDTPTRSELFAVQTPQVFLKELWLSGCNIVENPTDDSQLIEAMGKEVRIVLGDYRNIKITTPEDIILAEALIRNGDL